MAKTETIRYVHRSKPVIDYEVELPACAIPLQVHVGPRGKPYLAYLIPKDEDKEE